MKQLTWLALFLVTLLTALGWLVACQSADRPVASQTGGTAPERHALEPRALLELAATTPALRGALIQPHVVSARAMLEAEGYSYVEGNSLVMIQNRLEYIPSDFGAVSRGPHPPRHPARVDCIWTDTVTWLAFENPSHDLANHTAVLHLSNGQATGTVIVELDIGGEWPLVLRQGYMSDSGYIPSDIGTEGWLACALGGSAAAAVRCAFTNCGWAHCTAIGAGASVVGCTIGWLVDRHGK